MSSRKELFENFFESAYSLVVDDIKNKTEMKSLFMNTGKLSIEKYQRLERKKQGFYCLK